MTRITILLIAALALVVSACGTDTGASAEPSEPIATIEATPEPSPEPEESAEPAASASTGGNGGSETAIIELLPDEVGGMSRTDVDMAANPMFAEIFAEQGLDAADLEFVISTYGTGAEALGVTSMRVPDMGEAELEQLARLMTTMSEGQAAAEPGTVGGKSVLILSAEGEAETAYMYFAEGAVFVVGGGTEALVAEFLSQLP